MQISTMLIWKHPQGKAANVTTVVETVDKQTGKVIFENQSTVVLRGCGGFGGKKSGKGEY